MSVLKNKKQENLKKLLKKATRLKISDHLHEPGNGNNDLEFNNNGYLKSIEYFRQRYLIEKRRAERKGYEFSLIVIDLNGEEKQLQQDRINALLEEVEGILFSTSKIILRTTDVVVKYYPFKLAILLPDTDQTGAQLVIQRIKETLKEISDPSFQEVFIKAKIYCYSYPLQENEIYDFVNNKIFNKKTSTATLEKTIREVKSLYFEHKNINELASSSINLPIKIAPTNILAAENPFCLLNEVFFDFSCDWQKIIKRYLDILGSLLAIVFLSPMILLISILIKITSPGPVFFKQNRMGYMGKKFVFYKFRSMYQVENEQIHKKYVRAFINNVNHSEYISEKGQCNYKMKDDPRITLIGKFLRRTSLDEIGQFINVLKGDMSLVGPRPPIPYEVDMYDLWHKRRFLTVKPGITGLWQIYGRSSTTFNEMVRLDLAYAKNWSIILDFKILLKTIWVVLSMKGAY